MEVAVAAASGATKGSLAVLLTVLVLGVFSGTAAAGDTNNVYQPCGDAKVKRLDGFTFGVAFASQDAFVFNRTLRLSPCDRRLSLSSGGAKLAVFRPKVDEISLLTINTTNLPQPAVTNGGYMVAFAGRKYAAISPAEFVGDNNHVITSFTLVLEFEKGRLQNLFWKRDGCSKCSGGGSRSPAVCVRSLGCGILASRCKRSGGSGDVDCSLSIQVAFSGTDKHYTALNSWYEVSRLRQYSLYSLYSNLKGSVSSQLSQFFS